VTRVANSKTYGDDDPSFAYTLSGFKFGQTEAGLRAATPAALTGAASCTRTSARSVGGSPYTLTLQTPRHPVPPTTTASRTGNTANFTSQIRHRWTFYARPPTSKPYDGNDRARAGVPTGQRPEGN
jgi:hypothetical protein